MSLKMTRGKTRTLFAMKLKKKKIERKFLTKEFQDFRPKLFEACPTSEALRLIKVTPTIICPNPIKGVCLSVLRELPR